jgi:hypothetical protein
MSENNVNGFMINTCDAQILEVFPLTLTLSPRGEGNFEYFRLGSRDLDDKF